MCHSDVSVINGTIPWPPPAVMGHEGAGIVEAVGDGVTQVRPGDHVVVLDARQLRRVHEVRHAAGRPGAVDASATPSQPFTVGGEPACNFAATSCFAELTTVVKRCRP